jgi:hypothetical protein
LRVVVAAILAVAANAVVVAQHLLKLGAHLVTALARLHVHNLTRRSSLEAGSKREKKRRGGAEENEKLRVFFLARETVNSGGARACIPNGKVKWFYHSNLSSFGTVQSTLVVGGRGRKIFASATCSLQFGSCLSQQEKNKTADAQQG